MMKRRARVGLLLLGAMALGACEYGLGVPDAAVDPESTFTITNAGGTSCLPNAPVAAAVLDSMDAIDDGPPAPIGQADDEGVFAEDLEAPAMPGHYLVAAQCGGGLEEENPEGAFFDDVLVGQDFGMTVDRSEVELANGSALVQATFTPCKAENDFIVDLEIGEVPEGEVPAEVLELRNDFPDLEVLVDGAVVATVAGTERYPTEPIVVPVPLTTVGTHVIEGVCTYQTVRWNTALLAAIAEGDLPGEVSAAVAYPYPEDPETSPLIWDEDTLEASASVRVLAPVVGAGAVTPPAAPRAPAVQVAPRYTG